MVIYLDEKTVLKLKELTPRVIREAELRRDLLDSRATWFDDLSILLQTVRLGITAHEKSQICTLVQGVKDGAL